MADVDKGSEPDVSNGSGASGDAARPKFKTNNVNSMFVRNAADSGDTARFERDKSSPGPAAAGAGSGAGGSATHNKNAIHKGRFTLAAMKDHSGTPSSPAASPAPAPASASASASASATPAPAAAEKESETANEEHAAGLTESKPDTTTRARKSSIDYSEEELTNRGISVAGRFHSASNVNWEDEEDWIPPPEVASSILSSVKHSKAPAAASTAPASTASASAASAASAAAAAKPHPATTPAPEPTHKAASLKPATSSTSSAASSSGATPWGHKKVTTAKSLSDAIKEAKEKGGEPLPGIGSRTIRGSHFGSHAHTVGGGAGGGASGGAGDALSRFRIRSNGPVLGERGLPPLNPRGSAFDDETPTFQRASDSGFGDRGFGPFGGDRFGGDRFGGDRFGGDRFGGDRFGGDRFGGDRFGGDRFGGDRFGGGRGGFGGGGNTFGHERSFDHGSPFGSSESDAFMFSRPRQSMAAAEPRSELPTGPPVTTPRPIPDRLRRGSGAKPAPAPASAPAAAPKQDSEPQPKAEEQEAKQQDEKSEESKGTTGAGSAGAPKDDTEKPAEHAAEHAAGSKQVSEPAAEQPAEQPAEPAAKHPVERPAEPAAEPAAEPTVAEPTAAERPVEAATAPAAASEEAVPAVQKEQKKEMVSEVAAAKARFEAERAEQLRKEQELKEKREKMRRELEAKEAEEKAKKAAKKEELQRKYEELTERQAKAKAEREAKLEVKRQEKEKQKELERAAKFEEERQLAAERQQQAQHRSRGSDSIPSLPEGPASGVPTGPRAVRDVQTTYPSRLLRGVNLPSQPRSQREIAEPEMNWKERKKADAAAAAAAAAGGSRPNANGPFERPVRGAFESKPENPLENSQKKARKFGEPKVKMPQTCKAVKYDELESWTATHANKQTTRPAARVPESKRIVKIKLPQTTSEATVEIYAPSKRSAAGGPAKSFPFHSKPKKFFGDRPSGPRFRHSVATD